MGTEEIEILLGSPLNDPDLVRRAEPALKKRTFRRTKAGSAAIQDLPLTCYFDPTYYLARNPDVCSAGLHPYLHFLRYGLDEGRNPHPLIDLDLVRSTLSAQDIVPLTVQALADALDGNQVRPHRYFDVDYYLAANPDVRESGVAALRHYIRHGAAEGRLPHPDYDPERYVASVADAPQGSYEAFLHCIAHQPAAGGLPVSDATPASAMNFPPGGPRLTPDAIHGWLDSALDGVACGWAHDPQQPFKRLEVEIMKGPHVVGRGTATLHRADLQQAGYGDGRCAFAIKLSNLLSDGSSHLLTARVTGIEGTALEGELVYDAPAVAPRFDVLPSWEVARLCEHWSGDWKDRELAREFVSAVERCSLLLETEQGQAGLSGLQAIAEPHGSFELVQIKIGEAHLTLNAPTPALESYQRAFQGDALTDWALLGMGNCHRLLGNWEDAKDCYKRGLALSPGSARHGVRMRELEERVRALSARRFINAGDTESALRALMPPFVLHPDDSRLRDLVCEVLDAEEGETGNGEKIQLDAETVRSKRSVALLRKVLDHFSGSEGART